MFWSCLNRVTNKFKKNENNRSDQKLMISNKIYFVNEASYEHINHFIILLNYEIYLNLRSFNVILIQILFKVIILFVIINSKGKNKSNSSIQLFRSKL